MDTQNLKVLIVDDHMIMRNLVEKNASKVGITNPVFAKDGQDALQKAQSTRYDIIFADWNMPELSGIELLKEVRAMNEYEHSAFVMVTAEGEEDKMVEAMSSGATAYIKKPFSEEKFIEVTKKVLNWLEEAKEK